MYAEYYNISQVFRHRKSGDYWEVRLMTGKKLFFNRTNGYSAEYLYDEDFEDMGMLREGEE